MRKRINPKCMINKLIALKGFSEKKEGMNSKILE